MGPTCGPLVPLQVPASVLPASALLIISAYPTSSPARPTLQEAKGPNLAPASSAPLTRLVRHGRAGCLAVALVLPRAHAAVPSVQEGATPSPAGLLPFPGRARQGTRRQAWKPAALAAFGLANLKVRPITEPEPKHLVIRARVFPCVQAPLVRGKCPPLPIPVPPSVHSLPNF